MALLCLGASAFAAAKAPAPLAAAFVIDGKVMLADVPTRSLEPFALAEGLKPGEADLSHDKKSIVVNAWKDGASRLYLIDVATGTVKQLQVELGGNQLFPRFADDDRAILFSSALQPGHDSPANHMHLEKLHLGSGKVDEIKIDEKSCQFAAAPLSHGRVAHISTSCFINYHLGIFDERKDQDDVVSGVRDSLAEVASSTDGKKVVFTIRSSEGRTFFVKEASGKARKLASIQPWSPRVQPRFVCPQNVAFVNGQKIESIDSVSGQVTELMTIAEGLAAAKDRHLVGTGVGNGGAR